MRLTRKALILALVASALTWQAGFAAAPAAKKQTAPHKAKPATGPSVAEQLKAMQDAIQSQANQIAGLREEMAARSAELVKARQEAAEARAAAVHAESAAAADSQALTQNSAAVTALASNVTEIRTGETTLAATVSTETAKVAKQMENPSQLHFKGITLTPYGFFNGEAYYRTHATGGGEVTPWSALPFEHADSYQLSEFGISGQQSRVGLTMEGKLPFGTIRAYFEGDFLGVGTGSNNNQSSSYLLRQRIALAELETKNHWTISGGQGWTLAAENKSGITTAASNVALPSMVDPNYVAGLVWARMGNLRLTKAFPKAAFAISAENPQLIYSASLAGNTPYAVVGSAGLGASALNQAISGCSPSTAIVNYTNQTETDSAGNTVAVAVPVYKTLNSCANLTNISFNQAPDMIVKAAFDPGIGHYEIYGISRFFHETVYPGETTNSYLYGGYTDAATGAVIAPALTSSGATANSIQLGGIGGSARVPLFGTKVVVGAKALWGPGVGHFGTSVLADATSNAAGMLVPIHNLSGLLTAEFTPTPRLQIYTYYGGDYAGRADEAGSSASTLGAPVAEFCATVAGVMTCSKTATEDLLAAGGKWGAHWGGPSAAAVGYGSRLLNNSACTTDANPGYHGSSTGYYSGGGCGAQTRDVQEATVGYWYDLYKGDRGRLRQGFQYSYAVREGWSGAGGIGAKGVENMIFTSFRYFLP